MLAIYLFLFILNIIIGLIPLTLTHINKKSISFSISVFFLTGWSLSNFLIFSSESFLFWNQIAYFCASLFISSQIYFSIYLPIASKKISISTHILIILPTLLAISSSFSPYHIQYMNNPRDITFGPLHNIWTAYLIIFTISIVKICQQNKIKYPDKSKQINFYLLALIFSLSLATLCNLLLPSLFNETHFYKIGPLVASVFNFSVAYLILKYNFFNINLLINKIVASGICIFIYIFGYMSLSWVYKLYVTHTISAVYTILIGTYLIFCSLTFQTVRTKLQSTAEKLFLRGEYNYRKVMLNFSDYSSNCTNLTNLIRHLYTLLTDTLEISNVQIYIPEHYDKFKQTSKRICYFSSNKENNEKKKPLNPLLVSEIENKKKHIILSSELSKPAQEKLNLDYKKLLLSCFDDKNQLICLILLGKKMNESKYTQEDYELYRTLGNQIKVTLTKIKQLRVQTEMDMAQKIQSEIIPQNHSIPNCTTSTFLRSSDEVGGDFFDIHSKNDHNWIILGDVAGHGIGSGMVMLMIQSIFTSLIHSSNLTDPASINKKANKIICQNFERLTEPRPISLVTLNTQDGKTYKFHGNHENFFIYKYKEKKVVHHTISHLPFGIGLTDSIPSNCFASASFTLSEGDILFLATDGLTEAHQDGNTKKEQFNDSRITKLLEKFAHESPELIKESFINTLNDFTNKIYLDDLTFIIIKHNIVTTTPSPINK